MKEVTSGSGADEAIEQAAAEWLVRRDAGLSADEAQRLNAWLEQNPRHRGAWEELAGAWNALRGVRAVGQADEVRGQLATRAARRRKRRLGFAAIGGVGVLVGVLWSFRPGGAHMVNPEAPSIVARPNVRTLPDGSKLELNSGAEIKVRFSAERRAVELVRGEALFTVQKDPARPFVVTAGEVYVRAVGTEFAVQHGAERTAVLVTEGRVAVARIEAGEAAPLVLAAGGKAEVSADPSARIVAAAPLSPDQLALALAWRGKRVEFTRTTLAEAAALFNRQNRLQIAIADQAVADLTISGIFWSDDPDSFVRLLESGFAIQAHRVGEKVTLRPR